MNLRAPILSLALLLSAAALPASGQEAKQSPSNTVGADRKVQILWDPTARPPDINGVLRLVTAQAGEAGQQLLNVQPDVARRSFVWSPKLTVGDHTCTVSFFVRLDAENTRARPAAREFADRLVQLLADQLKQVRSESAAGRLDQARKYAANVEFELESLRRRRREMQLRLVADTGRADASPEGLAAAVGKLEDERQRLELDLAGKEARLEAVQEQIEQASQRAAKEAAADPVVPELEKAVEARQKLVELTRQRFDAGNVEPREVPKAEAELVEARVQLLDRRNAAGARGADALAPLTREMQDLAIDIRDRKARLAQVEKRLRPLQDVSQQLEELQAIQDQTQSASRAWEGAQALLREAQNQVELGVVDRVIVTDAGDIAAPAPEDSK